VLHEFAKLGIPLVAALPGGLPDLLTHGIGDACVTKQSSGDRRGIYLASSAFVKIQMAP
jgi:hypothetical protein